MKNKKLFAILTLVCFMFTLMPVAAFAAVDAGTTYVYTVKENPTVSLDAYDEAKVKIGFDVNDAAGDAVTTATNFYVWVTENGKPSTALKAVTGNPTVISGGNVFNTTAAEEIEIVFQRPGTFALHAAPVVEGKSIAQAYPEYADLVAAEVKTDAARNVITVEPEYVSTSKYVTNIAVNGNMIVDDQDNAINYVNGAKVEDQVSVDANSLDAATIRVYVKDAVAGDKVKGQEVEITPVGAIEVSDVKLNTEYKGYVEFDVTGDVDGEYYVNVEIGTYTVRIEVKVGAYDAAYIETVKEPTAPIDLDTDNLAGRVEFEVTDINGNVIVPTYDAADEAYAVVDGATGAMTNPAAGADAKHVKFVNKPAASDLENKDLVLVYAGEDYGWTLAVTGGFDAEGTYEMKVLLDNGKAAYATVEVKEFQKPVKLMLTYEQEAVELDGEAIVDSLIYIDANGVTRSLINADGILDSSVSLAANGYAVANFEAEGGNGVKAGTVKIEENEKYVGSEITVIAVSEYYGLTATATIKVTSDAAELKFVDKTAEVDVNNKIDVQLVDVAGNKVAPTNMTKGEISYVVLDKPADAKVSVTTASQKDLAEKGVFTMSLTSNKVGNVAVQAIAKLQNPTTGVVKYYTGSEIISVGTAGRGDVVVMSIGSNEIVINDAKAAIDAAPVVENNRTFVPFRALAEAFGATVAYDEATQAVTAELNGVTVVMTIGSAEYTVNGVAKTADVAPFINGSRTMVPVRFAAEAFGIKVIPTYDENGATADILFNL